MRDGMSTAKTNKMKSSLTLWNQVSYQAALNEKNRPGRRNTSLPQACRVMTDKTLLHFFSATPLLTPSALLLFSIFPLFRKQNWKQIRGRKVNIFQCESLTDMWHPMLCSLGHHKHFLHVEHIDTLFCVGQVKTEIWHGCWRKSYRGHRKQFKQFSRDHECPHQGNLDSTCQTLLIWNKPFHHHTDWLAVP